jgi:Transposase
VRVAPKHMAGARRSARERGKSDSIDAFSVARAALQKGVDNLPAAHLDGPALDIRLLVDHREELLAARGQDQQRLRWHLHDLWPELEIPAGALDTRKWLGKVSRRLARAQQTTRVRVARELVRQISARTARIRELESELGALVQSYAPRLLAERGCRPLTAAKPIGEIAGAVDPSVGARKARVGVAGRDLVERGTDPLRAERLAEAPHATAKAGRIIRVELQVRASEGDSGHRTTLAHHPADFHSDDNRHSIRRHRTRASSLALCASSDRGCSARRRGLLLLTREPLEPRTDSLARPGP